MPATKTPARPEPQHAAPPSRGFWSEAWHRFRRRKLAMIALGFVTFLIFVAAFAPAIAGTKPIVCKYKGNLYFPALGYFNTRWENPIFYRDRFRRIYPENLKVKDPDSWAIWPLVYQDPYRRVKQGEWPGQPGNPSGAEGSPNRFNWFGTNQAGVDVFAQMVHGTTIALLVGFVSMGIAGLIGITVGALAGYLGGWLDIAFSRLIEVVMCVPTLVLILALIAILDKPTIWHMMAIIGCTGWTSIARLARAEFMKLRQSDFVTAAQAIGASHVRDHVSLYSAERAGAAPGADHLRDCRGDLDRKLAQLSGLRRLPAESQLGNFAEFREHRIYSSGG